MRVLALGIHTARSTRLGSLLARVCASGPLRDWETARRNSPADLKHTQPPSRKQDRPDETRKTVMHLTLQSSRHCTVPRLAPVCPTRLCVSSSVVLPCHVTRGIIHSFRERTCTKRSTKHDTRPVPTQVCVVAVSLFAQRGQKVRTGCVPCIPSSAVLHPRYGMEATLSVSFPQVGFLVEHQPETRASLKPGDAGHRDVCIRHAVGYTVGYGYSTISLLFYFPFFVSLLVSLRGRFTFLASAGRGSCTNRQMQHFSQFRAVHRNLKPVCPCLPHFGSVRLYLHKNTPAVIH